MIWFRSASVLVLGTAGLPHIMMRFYTVPTARDARASANWVIGVVGIYLVMTTVLGFGAAAVVGHDKITAASKAGNSAAPLLALYLGGGSGTLGGEMLVAFISAVTFATILAVVAGLLIAAASNIAHDLYTHVVKAGVSNEKEEVRAARIATVAVGVVAIGLALSAKSLNVAFLVGPGLCRGRKRQPAGDSLFAVLASLQHHRRHLCVERRTCFLCRARPGRPGGHWRQRADVYRCSNRSSASPIPASSAFRLAFWRDGLARCFRHGSGAAKRVSSA